MIRDFLTAESHADAYVWMVVWIAHTAIGITLWTIMSGASSPLGGLIWTAVLFALFERAQGIIGGRMLWWDSVLDWVGVTFGAYAGWALWDNDRLGFVGLTLCVGAVGIIGGAVRR